MEWDGGRQLEREKGGGGGFFGGLSGIQGAELAWLLLQKSKSQKQNK
jgi:alanine dehydrogenase